MAKSFYFELCFTLLFAPFISAQGNRRTSEAMPESLRTQNNASLSFDKSFNTYHWTGGAIYGKTFGPLSLQFNEQFHSTLIRSQQNLIRNEQSLNFSMKHRTTERLHGRAQISSYTLSDNQSVRIGNAASHGFYGGIEYAPVENVTITPFVGARIDNQLGHQDKGPSYMLSLLAESLYYSGYRTHFMGKWEYDKLSPRTLETRNNALTVEKYFFGRTRNFLQVFYNRNRRDFYSNTDSSLKRLYNITHNIEMRNEDAFTISDVLDYNIGVTTFFTFQGDIFTRKITRGLQYQDQANPRRTTLGTAIDELNLDGKVEGRYIPNEQFNSTISFFYQERDERHSVESDQSIMPSVVDSASRIEGKKDNHARSTSLSFSVTMMPSSSDSLSLSSSGTLLRYDTPSDQNNDDRDELWYALHVAAGHRFSRYLYGQLTAEANLAHLVYIFSSRSADNTWNRIFKLSPRVEYNSGSGITSMNEFEVLANYTVYDFENIVSPIRSFAFRQFGFTDSTTVELTKRLSFDWFNQIRLYERGELRWSDFSEHPLNYFEDKTFLGMIRYKLNEYLFFSVGIRYFNHERFTYSGSNRQSESLLQSTGPVTSIQYEVGTRTSLSLKGWSEHQSYAGQQLASSSQTITTLSMSLRIQI